MNTRTDHYTFLGVPMDASSATIVAAIERLEQQANGLQQTDPAGALAIREKLRRAQEDLLSGAQRREGYDRWLLSTGAPRAQEPTISQPLPGLGPPEAPPQRTSVMPIQPDPPPPSTSGGSGNRWLIPLLVIAALLVGAGGALAATQLFGHRNAAVVSVTATTAPTLAAPTATVATTASPTQAATTATVPAAATAVATAQATAARATAAPAADPLTVDPALIKTKGYTPSQDHAETTDGAGGTLYAWEGVCTGSADGYCRKVFFFDGTRYLGTDTLNSSTAINSVQTAGPATIAVVYANYGKNDPLCCPSGQPVTITYRWTGTRLIPSGTPPGHIP